MGVGSLEYVIFGSGTGGASYSSSGSGSGTGGAKYSVLGIVG